MNLDLRRDGLLAVAVFWLALMVAVIATRPLTPVDETRYTTVAWEMYQSGDMLSLRLNGDLYGHKPPLMFWLIDLGWKVFGVNAWWPRLLSGLFGLGALALLARLAQRLAPGRHDIGAMALLITAGSVYWMAFTGAVMFDLMLAFFVLLGVFGIARAGAGGGWRAWLLVGAAIGLGILTKGPVALLHILPLALLGPWWLHGLSGQTQASTRHWGHWYRGVGLAVFVGAGIALAWAVPSALAGGGQFGREIFWSQSVDRMVNTEHHLRPAWFYLVTAPLLLLPWLFFPAVWRGLFALVQAERTLLVRFALAWAVPVFIGFSLFKGKQIQYLLPVVPAFALLAAGGIASLRQTRRWESIVVAAMFAALGIALLLLAAQPRVAHLIDPSDRTLVWLSAAVLFVAAIAVAAAPVRDRVATVTTIAAAAVAMVLGVYAGAGRAIFDGYDIAPVSRYLAQAQQQGRPIAHFGKYHGQFQFVGRLQRPLEVVMSPNALLAWAQRHPEGAVIVYARSALTHSAGAQPQFAQKFKGRHVYVWRGADLAGVSEHWYRATVEDDTDGS
jgi:4-amino-4-deoxy-L-arabinose transferase-like glycosyltransferase